MWFKYLNEFMYTVV